MNFKKNHNNRKGILGYILTCQIYLTLIIAITLKTFSHWIIDKFYIKWFLKSEASKAISKVLS